MIRHKRLEPKFVDDIPEQLQPGFLYVSMRYVTAVHLCCCGCNREVVTPFSPAQWRLTFDGENVSLYPSIGNWSLPCRSHYVLSNGRVMEAPSWSDEEIEHGRARDKRAMSAYYQAKTTADLDGAIPTPSSRKSWFGRISSFLTKHD
jgi:Family of unknown function (DUF6527)